VPAFPDQTFAGSVRSIAPSVDSKTRTVPVRIEPRNDDGRLRPGMFARVAIITAVKDDALLVPREAVLGDTAGAGPAVFAIDTAGRVRRQPVTLGIQNDQSAEIVRGLEFGQLVATGSLSELVEGDVVAPQVNNRLAYVR
jgi:RND family efflux transporter MFP subunit